MHRKECCRSCAGQLYDAFAAANGVHPDAVFEARLLASISRYPRLEEELEHWAEVRVGLMPPPNSATILKASCLTCEELVSVVVVGSPLLRATESLFDLFGSLVTRWDYVGSKLMYETRKPDEGEIQRFDEIVSEYARGEIATDTITTPRMSAPGVPHNARDVISRSIEIGQLWIVAHELSHALQSSVAIYLDLENLRARGWIEDILTYEFPEIGEDTRANWAVELGADVKATDIVFGALFDRMEKIKDHTMRRETAGGMLCGGLAVAVEAIYRLEVAVVGEEVTNEGYVPEHPPSRLRWKTSVERAGFLSRPRRNVDLACFGSILGGISQQFRTQHIARRSG